MGQKPCVQADSAQAVTVGLPAGPAPISLSLLAKLLAQDRPKADAKLLADRGCGTPLSISFATSKKLKEKTSTRSGA
jgi:hypothetical protein